MLDLIETESETLKSQMYGHNAGQPVSYYVLPYLVVWAVLFFSFKVARYSAFFTSNAHLEYLLLKLHLQGELAFLYIFVALEKCVHWLLPAIDIFFLGLLLECVQKPNFSHIHSSVDYTLTFLAE